jgi:hypothetical protein
MKKVFAIIIGLLFTMKAIAQIPYFAGTVGDGKLYGYSSVKFRPGINHQETYTTFQYGLGNQWATGIDLYTGPNCAYWGTLVKLPVGKASPHHHRLRLRTINHRTHIKNRFHRHRR